MRHVFLTLLFLLPLFCQSQTKILPAGTTVTVVLLQDISSKNSKVGDVINFETADEVIVNDFVMIHKGVKVIGRITESIKAKGKSTAGTLNFTIEKLYLENGNAIKLTTELKNKAVDNSKPAVIVVLNPFLLLKKGKNVSFEKGHIFTVYVDADTAL
jgi:hypothetical protein